MSEKAIIVKGARVHNLKNVTVEIPLNKLTVITGVSGSGKSSLAFDTIYAEGQRRYVESLSSYARQFLERMDKPDVDEVIGICPAIAIQQKSPPRNPRSTVATQTELYDFLRLLFARVGVTICRKCGQVVTCDNPESIADRVSALPAETRFLVLFPAAAGMPSSTESKKRAGQADGQRLRVQAHLMSLMQRGFTRFYRDGQMIELTSIDAAPFAALDDVFVVVDRLVVTPDMRSRLIDSLELCYREGQGTALIQTVGDGHQRWRFSEAFECKTCDIKYATPEPRLFSFNSAYGACPTCQGFGNIITFDPDLVVPNPALSIAEGAIEPFSKPQFEWAQSELLAFCYNQGIPTNVPFAKLTKQQQHLIFNGSRNYGGVRGFFDWLETKKYKVHVRVFLSKYRGYATCPDCHGTRLKSEALNIKVGGKTLPEVCAMSIRQCWEFFQRLTLEPEQAAIAERLLSEINHRLSVLVEVGLDYLTLDRLSSTLSGGESQRIQLATNLGASLVGTLYVLDEPSIGLHPSDNHRLINILHNLRDIGNTVIVVEHDAEMMRAADWLIDLGPGAGASGGHVIFQGPVAAAERAADSLTGRYLSGQLRIPIPSRRRLPRPGVALRIKGACANNLKNIDLDIPLGLFVCITGVSGSGKSTLMSDVIYANLMRQRGEWDRAVGAVRSVEGIRFLDDIVMVDQSPIGRTPRSNPATYTKAYDGIREAFASTREAKARGLTPAHFSFNVPGGRCETCKGDGTVTIEMQFLADVELVCEECRGTRFQASILDIHYKGLNIAEVLNLTVRDAMKVFADSPRVSDRLALLEEVGLGYLRLGQSATTLSGGEAQRIKLASYLARTEQKRALYLFDEPTTGLHFDDINRLLQAFKRLLDTGASIIVIEHNLDVIKCADWIIDLGPGGGDAGGFVVAQGPPEEIVKASASLTGKFLAPMLSLT
ncbi:MAG: excinuclease ABC subunit UvrA [Acidobacteriota bacterium]|nr:excinuclease ABC subunit UvrA [Blastocatellia bacterium]MDW8238149.1 excinuclease ABC subunit UvrA [Acidobacteriota bacterium]